MTYHQPVLVKKVVELLLEGDRRTFVDCTLGTGGHTEALLETACNPIRIFAFDRDPEALTIAEERLKGKNGVTLDQGNFARLDRLMEKWKLTHVDGILADLGQSSNQLSDPMRGFSHRLDGPLDMRYDKRDHISAFEIINSSSKEQLIHLFKHYGQERRAKAIAASIIRNRPVEGTLQLAKLVRKVCPKDHIEKTLARVFMALRVAVNDELSTIESFLNQSLRFLRIGGRVVVISYDSNQDSIVKKFFRQKSLKCICPPELPICICNQVPELKVLTPRVVKPDSTEISRNPRSRSARLRAAEKIADADEKED